MQRHFDDELGRLRNDLATMGTMAESMIRQGVDMLSTPSDETIKRLQTDEAEVNQLHMSIDDLCMRLLVLRQPAAADLRFIASTLKINGELERIGDQSINLMKRARSLDKHNGPYIDLSPLSRLASSMVADALDAFIKKDVKLARKVLEDEHSADDLRHEFEDMLVDSADAQAKDFKIYLQLVLFVHHLERIADHATNIAEDVIYFLEGRDVRHHHLS